MAEEAGGEASGADRRGQGRVEGSKKAPVDDPGLR